MPPRCLSAAFFLLFWATIAFSIDNPPHAGIMSFQNNTQPTNDAPYILRSPEVVFDVEGYPLAPGGLGLVQVYVFVRHGERAPVSVRLSRGPAPIPEHWMMCKNAHRFRDIIHGATGEHGEFSRRKIVLERGDGTVAYGECLLGELTDIGRQSTHEFGISLRKLYVDRLGFLPNFLQDNTEAYFRSTNIPRTIETLQHVLHGLYPSQKNHHFTPDILTRNIKDETLLPKISSCKRLGQLQAGVSQATAKAFNPTLEPLDKTLSRYIDGRPIRVDGHPSAGGIMDTVRAAIANGIDVPPEFKDNTIVDTIEEAVVNEAFADRTEEFRRLAMGPLLNEMIRKMQQKIDQGAQDTTKIFVHAAHDTSLGGICATLDVFDNQWPAFTASITFELFKLTELLASGKLSETPQVLFSTLEKTRTNEEYFVRMRYQNENLVLPLCVPEGKHFPGSPEFCSFAAFRERVKELTPDFEQECSRGTEDSHGL